MSDASIVLQQPAQAGELVLLFHGVGASAQSMAPLGAFVAQHSPQSAVVSVQAPNPSSLGQGAEWFSVAGITEANRPARIADAIPLFLEAVRHWQGIFDISPQATTLIGFSQGAIMSLHASLQKAGSGVAGQVFSLAGRFATEPEYAPDDVRFHLIHGEQDAVIAAQYSIQAARSLRSLGAKTSLDLLPGLGHGIDERVANLIQAHRSPASVNVTAARLTINENDYTLSMQDKDDWVDLTSLEGGAYSLIFDNRMLNDAALERAIEQAEDWLMPYAKTLQGKMLYIHDAAGKFEAGLRDVLSVRNREFSLTDIEDCFLQVVALASRYPDSPALRQQHHFVATLVLVRELAHHGALRSLRLSDS